MEIKETQEEIQNYGQELKTFEDIEGAWRKADDLGENMFVRLSDGRMMLVENAINSPVQPIVNCVYFKDENDAGKEMKLGILDDFLRLHPVVVDSSKEWEEKKKGEVVE